MCSGNQPSAFRWSLKRIPVVSEICLDVPAEDSRGLEQLFLKILAACLLDGETPNHLEETAGSFIGSLIAWSWISPRHVPATYFGSAVCLGNTVTVPLVRVFIMCIGSQRSVRVPQRFFGNHVTCFGIHAACSGSPSGVLPRVLAVCQGSRNLFKFLHEIPGCHRNIFGCQRNAFWKSRRLVSDGGGSVFARVVQCLFLTPTLFGGTCSVSQDSCYVLESSHRVQEVPTMCSRVPQLSWVLLRVFVDARWVFRGNLNSAFPESTQRVQQLVSTYPRKAFKLFLQHSCDIYTELWMLSDLLFSGPLSRWSVLRI